MDETLPKKHSHNKVLSSRLDKHSDISATYWKLLSGNVGVMRRIWLTMVTGMILALPVPALAVLGGDAASVEADQVHMQGTLKVEGAETFTVHEIQAPSGTVVREYVSPAGKVFAIAWQGPWLPDLRQILGPYFEPYERAAAQNRRERHGPLLIEEPGLVVQLNGHMRAFVGRAYVPQMMPEGVHAEAIR